MRSARCDVAIIGSGAGGGTVAQALIPLATQGRRVIVFEQGGRLEQAEFTGIETEMAESLYEDGGGFLTEEGTLSLAFGRTFGGSTAVYSGTSLVPSARVIEAWAVPGLTHEDLVSRCERHAANNGVHLLPPEQINDNNRLFREGCLGIGLEAEQFPVNVRGCRGASLCNLGCPNGAKQGTDRVQLPAAERGGVEVVTRAEVRRIGDRRLVIRVERPGPGEKGAASAWPAGEYSVEAPIVVVAGGSVGSSALLLRSGLGSALPRLGEGFTCHPALILVGEHEREITNDVGHPKSYYLDRSVEERFVLETCMYFPFVTAKNLTGFGPDHSTMMRSFRRLQMILALACDRATQGNRISVDRSGRPRVHYRFTPEVREALAAANRAAARIFFAAGALRVHAPLANPPLLARDEAARIAGRITATAFIPGKTSISAAHLMGGCGMGSSPTDSVTDSWGRVHGLPWLRIADSSLFPDSLEINPYLTVMALADRTAEAVLEDAGRLLANRGTGLS
ncbi:MAG: GMC family oxidoreductase [Candidatus Palauibacterales bacterium]|nr:GMC family oxidoreductase [Candidatus Palauibacterales bacterium]